MDELFTMLRTIVSGLNFDFNMKKVISDRFLLGGFTKESVSKLKYSSTIIADYQLTVIQKKIKAAIRNGNYDDNTKPLLLRMISYLCREHLQRYTKMSARLKKYCQFFALLLRDKFTIEEVKSIAYCNPIFFIEELSEVFGEIDINDIVYRKICDIKLDKEPDYDSIYKEFIKKMLTLECFLTEDTISAVQGYPITAEILSDIDSVTPDIKGLELIINSVLPEKFRILYRLYFGFTSDKKPLELEEIKDFLEYSSIKEVKDAMSVAYNIINALLLSSNLPSTVQTYIRVNFKYVEFTAAQGKVNDYISFIKSMLLSGTCECDDITILITHINKLFELGAIERRVYDFVSGILNNKETIVDDNSEVLIEQFIRAYRYFLHQNNIYYSPYMEKIVKQSTGGFGAL